MRTKLLAVALLILVLLSLCPTVVGKTTEEEQSLTCLSQSIFMDISDYDYLTVNWAETGNKRTTNALVVGQQNANGLFAIYRTMLFFNTSDLAGKDIKVKEAYIRLWVLTCWTELTFDIVAQIDNGTYPHCPAVAGDYSRRYYDGFNVGAKNTESMKNDSYFFIDLKDQSWLNQEGVTSLVLRSQRDIDEIEPADTYPPANPDKKERVWFDSSRGTNPPILYVKYQNKVKAGKGTEGPQGPQINPFVFVILAGAGATVLYYSKQKPEDYKKRRWEW